MFFAVIAKDKPGLSELRAQTKARHKAHLDAAAPGLRVLQSGPLLSPDGGECGSLLVLEAETAQAVEAFLSRDPYVQAGLFASSEIHPWLWRRGNPYLIPA
ncbi:MAG TPA: YciI family protein [Roseiarcus sp.]|jgi:hypothetical protein